MRHAMCGADGETGGVFAVLDKVPAFAAMKNDLLDTYEDAHELTMLTLQHEAGEFTGLSKMNSLDDVEGFGFPKEEIETLEDDLLCQISIIFVMLDFATKRVATIISSNVRKS